MKRNIFFVCIFTTIIVMTTGCSYAEKRNESVVTKTSQDSSMETKSAEESSTSARITTTASITMEVQETSNEIIETKATQISTEPDTTGLSTTQPVTTETEIQPVTDVQVDSGWENAYKQILLNYNNFSDDAAWDLQDLDGDGIPELLISEGTFDAAGVILYYFDGSKACQYEITNAWGTTNKIGEMGTIDFSPQEHLILESYLNSGTAISFYYKAGLHDLNCLLYCFSNVAAGMDENNYQVDGNNVSSEEYFNAINQYSAKQWNEVGRQYNFGDYSALEK